jgi:hypothetical protein
MKKINLMVFGYILLLGMNALAMGPGNLVPANPKPTIQSAFAVLRTNFVNFEQKAKAIDSLYQTIEAQNKEYQEKMKEILINLQKLQDTDRPQSSRYFIGYFANLYHKMDNQVKESQETIHNALQDFNKIYTRFVSRLKPSLEALTDLNLEEWYFNEAYEDFKRIHIIFNFELKAVYPTIVNKHKELAQGVYRETATSVQKVKDVAAATF